MRNEKGNMLLIELVIAILFFALSMSVILQVFAGAQRINRNAEVQNLALLRAEDTAETLAVSDNAEASLLSLGFSANEAGYLLADEDGFELTASISRFSQPSGQITTVELCAYQNSKTLFTLPVVRYQGVNAP